MIIPVKQILGYWGYKKFDRFVKLTAKACDKWVL